jgi:hypothetical protein
MTVAARNHPIAPPTHVERPPAPGKSGARSFALAKGMRLVCCYTHWLLFAWTYAACDNSPANSISLAHQPNVDDASTSEASADGAAASCPSDFTLEEWSADFDGDGVANGKDCAPCDASRYRTVVNDDDGDGVQNSQPPLVAGQCVGANIPPGYALVGPSDCDDKNPALYRSVCLDADQDGWCAMSSVKCVGKDIDPGYRLTETAQLNDCDDSDPARQQPLFYDEDGDGDRADSRHPSTCVAASDAGSISQDQSPGHDCDDHDRQVSSRGVDLLFDGLDTNCDGDDGNTQCAEVRDSSAECPCWPRDTCRAAITCANRPDLNIVDHEFTGEWCGVCYAHGYTSILLVNTGGAVFDGSFMVSTGEEYPGRESALVLAPGESRILRLCRGALAAKLEIVSGDDCLPDNNSIVLPVSAGFCGD